MALDLNLLLVELAKIALQTYFNYLRLAGKSEEEIQQVYEKEKMQFLENCPSKLPDV